MLGDLNDLLVRPTLKSQVHKKLLLQQQFSFSNHLRKTSMVCVLHHLKTQYLSIFTLLLSQLYLLGQLLAFLIFQPFFLRKLQFLFYPCPSGLLFSTLRTLPRVQSFQRHILKYAIRLLYRHFQLLIQPVKCGFLQGTFLSQIYLLHLSGKSYQYHFDRLDHTSYLAQVEVGLLPTKLYLRRLK